MDHAGKGFGSFLAKSPASADLPEWVDCDSEYVEAIEREGLQILADEAEGHWTWHHEYLFKLPEAERSVLVALCERHCCMFLTWQQAADILHSALGDPPDFDQMIIDSFCEEITAECNYTGLESTVEDEDGWNYYDEDDSSDIEPDMGYREDYNEDDTNWDSHDEQDEDVEGLSIDGDDDDGDDGPDYSGDIPF